MNLDRTVVDVLEQACARFTDKPAFTALDHTLTYADIDHLSKAFATWLHQHSGLQAGDRIAIQLPNLLQYPIAVFGALRAGLVVVNTNPLYTPRELEHQFRDSGAKALLVLDMLADTAQQVVPDTMIETVITTGLTDLHESLPAPEGEAQEATTLKEILAHGAALPYRQVSIQPEQLAVLQYTGGTTGVAKGAMLSHRNLVANMEQLTEHSRESFIEGEETYVAPLPLYHIYAFTLHCIAVVAHGGHNLLIPNPRDLPSLVQTIATHPFTGFVGINTLFNALCRDEQFRQLDFSHLKSTAAGGMALGTETAQEWHSLTGIEIAEGYGMTESSPVISANPRTAIQPGTVGLPVPDTEVKVIDAEGRTLPAGEPGELCVRGPQVMQGYWQRPEATAETLSEDGWLRTGDIAVIQEDGYIRIVDRKKDMIVVSGFNVYPNELEDVACTHPSVLECAAIGVPDDKTGEGIKLFVVPADNTFDADALRTYMRGQLTAYKVPAYIETMDELPKSNVGKILRKELR